MRGFVVRVVVFALFAVAAIYADALMSAVGIGADAASRDFGRGTFHSLAWIAGAFATISAVNLFFWEGLVAQIAGRPVPTLLKNVLAVIVFVLAITGIIGVVFGRDVTGIWATSGVVGIVLGFALRSMIQDIFTGIAINLDGSLKAGDWIALHDRDFGMAEEKYGQLLDIGWRVSRMQLENRNVIVVPNSRMGMMPVTNFAHSDYVSRLQTELVIDFDVPTERARRILLAGVTAAVGKPGILPAPPPEVVIGDATDNGVKYFIRFSGDVTASSQSTMLDEVMTHLLQHLRIAGLTPALPKEDVFIERRPNRILAHEDLGDRVEVLTRVDLFARALKSKELETLAGQVSVAAFGPARDLVRQGAVGESMFIVTEGIAEVRLRENEDSDPIVVGRIEAGQVFGEMSLFTGEPRSASVVAVTGVVVYEITQAHFEKLLSSRPAIADQISALIAERRLRTAAAREATTQDAESQSQALKEQILEKMKSVFTALRALGGKRRVHSGQSQAARA